MSIPVLDNPESLGVTSNGSDESFVKLALAQRRLGEVLADVEAFREECAGREGWGRVEDAARTAGRALYAALDSITVESGTWRGPSLEVDGLRVDMTARCVSFEGAPLRLTRLEFALLVALGREPSRVFTKAELLRDVWDYRSLGRTRTLDSHASRLRRKLTAAGAPEGRYVVSLWGVGYSLIRP